MTSRWLVRGGLVVIAVFTAVLLLLPIAVIIPMSFAGGGYLEFPPQEWSTRWFENFLTNPTWQASTLASLQVAALVTVTSVVLGTAAALGLTRGSVRFRSVIAGLVIAPLIVPYVIVGLAMYAVALEVGLTQTPLGFVLVHSALAVPYVTVNVAAGLASYDETLEQASMSLGASPLVTFLRVTLPNIASSVLAGALFAFAISWDEVIVSIFLSGPALTTLPVQMWSGVRVQVDPTVTAVSTMLVLVTLSMFAVAGVVRLMRKRRLSKGSLNIKEYR